MFRTAHLLFFAAGVLATFALAVVSSDHAPARASTPLLYGVTGEGGSNPESLFEINIENAHVRLLAKLGNGGDGEEIAYDPRRDLLLHASGRADDMVLEWVNPWTFAVTPIAFGGDDCDEVSGLTYMGRGMFLAGTIDFLLCSISSDGVITEVATVGMADIATGLAWMDGKLYATEWGNRTQLHILNPSNGEVISAINLDVHTDYRFTALAAHPCTGQLYAVMAVGATEIRTPGPRSLVTIDPSNGHVAVIGDLGESFAGLAFVGDSCGEEPGAPGVAHGAVITADLHTLQAGAGDDLVIATETPTASPQPLMPTATPTPAPSVQPAIIRPPSTGNGGLLGG